MNDIATFESLLGRLKAATGPDRELDAQIWLALTDGATRKASVVKSDKGLWPDYTIDETRDATGMLITVPSYTSDISSAFIFVRLIIPQSSIQMFDDTTMSEAYIIVYELLLKVDYYSARFKSSYRKAGQLPLALCEALLTALVEIEKRNGQSK